MFTTFNTNLKNAHQKLEEEGKPFCSLCQKPVEFFERSYNQKLKATVFDVFCHGESKQILITMGHDFIDNVLKSIK